MPDAALPSPAEVPAGPLLLRPGRAGDAPAVRAALTDPATDVRSNPGRVRLVHAVANPASGRVAERAGSTIEGRLRRSSRYGDGVERDELLWARLADDDVPGLSSRS